MIAFGPVPSRRLGSSLGINHVPPKHCTYSCIYCQVGRTDHLEIKRQEFYPVDAIVQSVEQKIHEVNRAGKQIDFLTFVPDGEPTLDLNLGKEIEALRRFGLPIAVISNATLIDQEEVRRALSLADWVSLKLDSAVKESWHKINRPHGSLDLDRVLQGMLQFASQFQGKLVTETMLVKDINDREDEIDHLVAFLYELQPIKAYLSIPTRPPAENWVHPPSLSQIRSAYRLFLKKVPVVELLADLDEGQFFSTGQLADDILGITAVHPVTERALKEMVHQARGEWSVVESLVQEGSLEQVMYRDQVYYRKNF